MTWFAMLFRDDETIVALGLQAIAEFARFGGAGVGTDLYAVERTHVAVHDFIDRGRG